MGEEAGDGMEKKNTGIDYGSGLTNIDRENNIRYGVISMNEVIQFWGDESNPIYSNSCPICGNEPKTGNDIHSMSRCPSCYKPLDDNSFSFDEPIGYILNNGEYQATSDDTGDIFITKSPYYTLCQFCSPCAPGAGYITNTVENGVKSYCFGHDCFDDENAPYPVYSVKTGEKIDPVK